MSGAKGGFQKEQRNDRLIHEHIHDPYRSRKKIQEPAFCSQCGAVYSGGRWQWCDKPGTSHEEICPACNRINDKCPAGVLTLKGEFLLNHKDELLGLIKNEEKLESGEHPIHRVINIRDEEKSLEITTTDIHLPRRMGEALKHAYKGELDFHYEEETCFIRVNWSR